MPKFKVYYSTSEDWEITVEADSAEEAQSMIEDGGYDLDCGGARATSEDVQVTDVEEIIE